MTSKLRIVLIVFLGISSSIISVNAQDLDEIRQMIQEMKKSYEEHIDALEARLRVAEEKLASTQQSSQRLETQASSVTRRNQPGSTKGRSGLKRIGDNTFNPAISFVLQGGAAAYSLAPEDYSIDGLPLGGETGLQQEGLSLRETEIVASGNIDNLFYAQTTLGLHQDGDELELDLEEVFIDTLNLPAGLGIRFGRFYSDIGYLNPHHTHTWDFADAPLVYQAFLGNQYRDDGIRATWVAPTEEIFLEAGIEVFRGGAYPGGGNAGDLETIQHGFVHIGGDIDDNNSWQFGLSYMDVDVISRTTGGHAHDDDSDGPNFVGESQLSGIDFIWKRQLSGGRSLKFQSEYFMRDEEGLVTLSETEGDALFHYIGDQSGWYAQGVFQFAPRWRAGVRYDYLTADNDLTIISNATGESNDEIFEESGFESGAHNPDRWTAMLDWTPSEFSRVRIQYAYDNSRVQSDSQFMLQYIMSLGAHSAHSY